MSDNSSENKFKNLQINQLRVLTGVEDTKILCEAYENSKGDLTKAIGFVTNYKPAKEIEVEMPDLTGHSGHRKRTSISTESQTSMDVDQTSTSVNFVTGNSRNKPGNLAEQPVIDLTDSLLNSEDADLQRAIKLSMECSSSSQSLTGDPQNFMERTRNNSISGTSTSTATTRDPSNPNLRRRKAPDWPAGLKNVGNTCWFSAVVQSLFNLPIFRNLILHYKAPSKLPPENSEAYRNICFMQELKKLFALLVASNQSYIDPSKCVLQLQGFVREKSIECQQQDVSEFTHKLLDWLEDAFKHQTSSNSMDTEETRNTYMEVDGNGDEASGFTEKLANPMVDLFYGEYKAHGINNGNSFTKPQKFGLFPLYVHEADDLHQSLELTTRDRIHQDGRVGDRDGVGQELWFTSLPPVLIFELSRFHYNQQSAVPEKIHSRLDFPNILYMDRYMEANAERTRHCREDSQKLRAAVQEMKAELKSKRKITLGEKSYLIHDVLQCCTEFAASRRKRYIEDEKTVTLRDGMSPSKKSREELGSLMDTGSGDAPIRKEPTTETEFKIARAAEVEQCLKSWMAEIEAEKEGLRDDITDLQKRLDTMYDDPALKKHPYVLHAVLVHQGHAVAGHYWAYVRDHCKSRWLKFNDTNVTVADWNELISDSVGGGSSIASAYCLMYIDRKKTELLMGTPNGEKVLSSDNELQDVIEKHNNDFANEVEEWDTKQAMLLSLSGTQMEDKSKSDLWIDEKEDDSKVSTATGLETPPLPPKRERNDSLSSWHTSACREAIDNASGIYDVLGAEETMDHDILDLTFQASMLAIAKVGDTFNMEGPESALLKVVKEEWKRLKELATNSTDATVDPRLQHIAVYMFKNNAPRKVIERALLEQFADSRMSYDPRSTEIMKCAEEKLKGLSPEDLNDEEFKRWQRDYQFFCRATCYLIRGLELCHGRDHADALPYLANVKVENERLSATADGESSEDRLADWGLASKTASICIRNLHEKALKKFFSTETKVALEGLDLVEENVVPWLHLLSNEDPLLEKIRSDWCSADSTNDVQEKLEGALRALLEPPTSPETQAAIRAPTLIRPHSPQDLCDRFHKAMSTMLTAECR